jgi:hypothetical protein
MDLHYFPQEVGMSQRQEYQQLPGSLLDFHLGFPRSGGFFEWKKCQKKYLSNRGTSMSQDMLGTPVGNPEKYGKNHQGGKKTHSFSLIETDPSNCVSRKFHFVQALIEANLAAVASCFAVPQLHWRLNEHSKLFVNICNLI